AWPTLAGRGRAHPPEQAARLADRDLGPAVLAAAGAFDAAAELVRHHLHAIADPQHRHAETEQCGVGAGRARLVDALRAAGEDQAEGLPGAALPHGTGAE